LALSRPAAAGRWHGRFVHVPMPLAIRERYQVDPNGDLWMSVLESTGQSREFASGRVPLVYTVDSAA
jgi:6-phosphofructokinase 1